MPEATVLKPEEARKRLLLAYRAGKESSFLEMLTAPMPEATVLKPEEARKRLLLAYRAGKETSFLEMLIAPVLDPVDQRDVKGKRRLHPLFVVGGVLFLLAVAAFSFFTLHK